MGGGGGGKGGITAQDKFVMLPEGNIPEPAKK